MRYEDAFGGQSSGCVMGCCGADPFGKPDIDAGVFRFRRTPGAVLLDVREADEYAEGHIPGSASLPLSRITSLHELVPDRKTNLFVYGRSDSSAQAVKVMRRMGYGCTMDLGAMSGYTGEVEP